MQKKKDFVVGCVKVEGTRLRLFFCWERGGRNEKASSVGSSLAEAPFFSKLCVFWDYHHQKNHPPRFLRRRKPLARRAVRSKTRRSARERRTGRICITGNSRHFFIHPEEGARKRERERERREEFSDISGLPFCSGLGNNSFGKKKKKKREKREGEGVCINK